MARRAPVGQLMIARAGFSLLEVMMVLVIIGILMMIAVPLYEDSMRKSHRADGMRDLMELSARQERFYAQNSVYTGEIGEQDGADENDDVGLNFSGGSSERCKATPNAGTVFSSECHYTLSVEACSEEEDGVFSRCYVLIAEPRGGQQQDPCGTLTVNSLGQRGHRGSPGNNDLNCW